VEAVGVTGGEAERHPAEVGEPGGDAVKEGGVSACRPGPCQVDGAVHAGEPGHEGEGAQEDRPGRGTADQKRVGTGRGSPARGILPLSVNDGPPAVEVAQPPRPRGAGGTRDPVSTKAGTTVPPAPSTTAVSL